MSGVQIFISYARDDDAVPPDVAAVKGFVSSLLGDLGYQFVTIGPQPRPTIWRDTRQVERGEQFDQKIADAITESSIMLVVLSPNWMASHYCRQELDVFTARWKAEGELGLRRRLVVVGKRHIDPDRRPSALQRQEGFRFYSREDPGEVGLEREFFTRGTARDPRYHDRVEELAAYLWRLSARMTKGSENPIRSYPPPEIASTPANGRAIYLAKPAVDMRIEYDRLGKELQAAGYTVVPDPTSDLPTDSSAVAQIDKALEAAELSIHILGEWHGFVPDGGEKRPIVDLQLARAAARVPATSAAPGGADAAFRRIIWAPAFLGADADTPGSAAKRDPFDVLGKFGEKGLPTDTIEAKNISKFVEFLLSHLVRKPEPIEVPEHSTEGKQVYLYHSDKDTDYAMELYQLLQDRKANPIVPAFSEDPTEAKVFHQQQLRQCDAVIVCWAQASEVWARAQSSELGDWQKLGRSGKFDYRSVIAGPPPGGRKKYVKQVFPQNQIDIIVDLTASEHPQPNSLDPLFTPPT